MTDFTSLMASIAKNDEATADGDRWSVTTTEDWLQGRTIYGGLSAALCIEGATREFAELPPLRSAQFSFVGPATGRLTIHPKILRRGKSTVFIGVDLIGQDGLATRAALCYGAARESAFSHGVITMPNVPKAEDCADFFRGAPRLNFMHHFDFRAASGTVPFSGATDPTMLLWMQHRDERARRGSIGSLIALADAPPPAAMVLFKQFAPISTMTWSIDLLTDRPQTENGWWLVRTSAENIDDGYSSQAMTVWNKAGTPVMVSRQNVAVFA